MVLPNMAKFSSVLQQQLLLKMRQRRTHAEVTTHQEGGSCHQCGTHCCAALCVSAHSFMWPLCRTVWDHKAPHRPGTVRHALAHLVWERRALLFGERDVVGVGAQRDAVLVQRLYHSLLQLLVVRVEVEHIAHDVRDAFIREHLRTRTPSTEHARLQLSTWYCFQSVVFHSHNVTATPVHM